MHPVSEIIPNHPNVPLNNFSNRSDCIPNSENIIIANKKDVYSQIRCKTFTNLKQKKHSLKNTLINLFTFLNHL